MIISIVSETDDRVHFSNDDEVYEGCGIYRGRWLIDSKERREKSDAYFKNGGGFYCTSWFLEALNKSDALKEYALKTGDLISNVS